MILWTVSMCLAFGVNGPALFAQQPDPSQPAKPAQTPAKPDKPASPSLDDLLAQALKNNPDIRVAEAKLREAEAELNRARFVVTQKVVVTQHARDVQQGAVEQADRVLQMKKKPTPGESWKEEFRVAQQNLAQTKAKLSELDAELAFLTGKPLPTKAATVYQPLAIDFRDWHNLQGLNRVSNLTFEGTVFPSPVDAQRSRILQSLAFPPIQTAPGSATDKLRKALDTQVEVKFDSAPLHDVLEFLEKSTVGVSFRILDPNDREKEVRLHLKTPVSVGAVLQALEDSFTEGSTGLRFVVRDYGILVTWEDRIPPGALRVESLWKAERTSAPQKGAETDPPKKQPPPNDKP